MQIFGPFRVSAAQNPQAAQANNRINAPAEPASSPSKLAKVDKLDLSSAAREASAPQASDAIAGGGEIRLDRVAEIRRSIASGTYDTPEKMDIALGRMLDQLG